MYFEIKADLRRNLYLPQQQTDSEKEILYEQTEDFYLRLDINSIH